MAEGEGMGGSGGVGAGERQTIVRGEGRLMEAPFRAHYLQGVSPLSGESQWRRG